MITMVIRFTSNRSCSSREKSAQYLGFF
jgi:hypothetical protein